MDTNPSSYGKRMEEGTKMLFVGSDFGRRKFEVQVTNEKGELIGKSKEFKNKPNEIPTLITELEKKGHNTDTMIFGLETAGNFWVHVAKFLDKKNITWYPIHPTRVYHLRKAETGGTRTDAIDAWLAAKAAREDHFNPKKSPGTTIHKSVQIDDGLKELTRLREMGVRHNRAYKKSLGDSTHLTFPGYWSHWGRNYTLTGLRILTDFPSWSHVLSISREDFNQSMGDINNTALRHANELYSLAEESKGTPPPSNGELMKIRHLIPLIQQTGKEIKAIEKDIEVILEQKHEEGQTNLQAIKGFGQVIESVILAETGNIGRFRRIKNYSSYSGVIPVPDDSADTKKDRRPKKNGNGNLRAAFITAAVAVIEHNSPFRALYVSKLNQYGGPTKEAKRRARLYIANKLSRIVYHLLKTNEEYSEKKMLEIKS